MMQTEYTLKVSNDFSFHLCRCKKNTVSSKIVFEFLTVLFKIAIVVFIF